MSIPRERLGPDYAFIGTRLLVEEFLIERSGGHVTSTHASLSDQRDSELSTALMRAQTHACVAFAAELQHLSFEYTSEVDFTVAIQHPVIAKEKMKKNRLRRQSLPTTLAPEAAARHPREPHSATASHEPDSLDSKHNEPTDDALPDAVPNPSLDPQPSWETGTPQSKKRVGLRLSISSVAATSTFNFPASLSELIQSWVAPSQKLEIFSAFGTRLILG